MSSFRPALALALSAVVAGCAATTGRPSTPEHASGATAAGAAGDAPTSAAGEPCGSFYARVCGAHAERAEDRATRHKTLVRDVEAAVLGALAAQLGLPAASREAWRAHLAAQPAEAQGALERLFRKVHVVEVARRVAPLEGAVRAELERLRALALTQLRLADRRLGHAAIRRVERAALAWIDLSSAHEGQVPRPLRLGCGAHLLIDDAWVTKDAGALTLCPGFLLVSLDAGDPRPDGPAFRERISFLLAHELGHIAIGPTVDLQHARDAEIAADALAAELLALDLAARPVDARDAHLRRALEPICGPEGDHTHAPGRVRVEDVVARHPEVAATLRCPVDVPWTPSG